MKKKHMPLGNTAQRPEGEAEGFVIADSPVPPARVVSFEADSHAAMNIITCWMTPAMTRGIELLVRAGKYLSRSDAIRAAIRQLLDDEWPRWVGS